MSTVIARISNNGNLILKNYIVTEIENYNDSASNTMSASLTLSKSWALIDPGSEVLEYILDMTEGTDFIYENCDFFRLESEGILFCAELQENVSGVTFSVDNDLILKIGGVLTEYGL